MNKDQLISLAAKEAGTTQEITRMCLDAISKTIVQTLGNNENVSIRGLGTFLVKVREESKKVLPANGKGPKRGISVERTTFIIKKKKIVKFNVTPLFISEYPDEDHK